MEVDATEVDDDDETFLKNYDEAYAVYEANNPDLIRADGTNDIIKEGHNKNYPNIIYLKMLYVERFSLLLCRIIKCRLLIKYVFN